MFPNWGRRYNNKKIFLLSKQLLLKLSIKEYPRSLPYSIFAIVYSCNFYSGFFSKSNKSSQPQCHSRLRQINELNRTFALSELTSESKVSASLAELLESLDLSKIVNELWNKNLLTQHYWILYLHWSNSKICRTPVTNLLQSYFMTFPLFALKEGNWAPLLLASAESGRFPWECTVFLRARAKGCDSWRARMMLLSPRDCCWNCRCHLSPFWPK